MQNCTKNQLVTCTSSVIGLLELKYFIYPAAVSLNEEHESKKFAQYEHSLKKRRLNLMVTVYIFFFLHFH